MGWESTRVQSQTTACACGRVCVVFVDTNVQSSLCAWINGCAALRHTNYNVLQVILANIDFYVWCPTWFLFGPLLFILYTNDLFVKKIIPYYLRMTPRQNICYFLDPPVQSEETVLLMSDKIIKPTHCIIFLRLYIDEKLAWQQHKKIVCTILQTSFHEHHHLLFTHLHLIRLQDIYQI